MLSFLKRAVDGSTNTVDERRFITIMAFFMGMVIALAVVILSFVVALHTGAENVNANDAMNKLIYSLIAFMVFILLLAGIITWQNVNDTITSVKGIPPQILTTASTITKTVEEQHSQINSNLPPPHEQ